MASPVSLRSLVIVIVAGATVGCQPLSRVEECRTITSVVNAPLAAIDADRQKAPDAPATYRSATMRYEGAAHQLESLKLKNRKLSDLVGEYVKVLREGSRDARAFAEALEAKDAARQAATRTLAGRTVKHEGAIAGRLDAFCRGH